MFLAVEAAYALQRNTPILVGSGRPSAAVDLTTINLREVSRFYPVIPPVPLISTVLTRTKPNLMILLRVQPDPTIPMNNRPSFSRRLAGATKTPLRPPDSPRSRPRPLVSSNGNATSHVELGPSYVFGQRKLLNLWNFERHRSHATRDRKRTAHVSTSIIEHVSHRIRRLLSARVCRLLNVCLRRLSIGSESHLTVA